MDEEEMLIEFDHDIKRLVANVANVITMARIIGKRGTEEQKERARGYLVAALQQLEPD